MSDEICGSFLCGHDVLFLHFLGWSLPAGFRWYRHRIRLDRVCAGRVYLSVPFTRGSFEQRNIQVLCIPMALIHSRNNTISNTLLLPTNYGLEVISTTGYDLSVLMLSTFEGFR